jgi:hypothetical protein
MQTTSSCVRGDPFAGAPDEISSARMDVRASIENHMLGVGARRFRRRWLDLRSRKSRCPGRSPRGSSASPSRATCSYTAALSESCGDGHWVEARVRIERRKRPLLWSTLCVCLLAFALAQNAMAQTEVVEPTGEESTVATAGTSETTTDEGTEPAAGTTEPAASTSEPVAEEPAPPPAEPTPSLPSYEPEPSLPPYEPEPSLPSPPPDPGSSGESPPAGPTPDPGSTPVPPVVSTPPPIGEEPPPTLPAPNPDVTPPPIVQSDPRDPVFTLAPAGETAGRVPDAWVLGASQPTVDDAPALAVRHPREAHAGDRSGDAASPPGSPVSLPGQSAPAVAGGGSAAPSSGGSSGGAGTVAALAILLVLSVPWLGRLLRCVSAAWRPVAFVSPLERPG